MRAITVIMLGVLVTACSEVFRTAETEPGAPSSEETAGPPPVQLPSLDEDRLAENLAKERDHDYPSVESARRAFHEMLNALREAYPNNTDGDIHEAIRRVESADQYYPDVSSQFAVELLVDHARETELMAAESGEPGTAARDIRDEGREIFWDFELTYYTPKLESLASERPNDEQLQEIIAANRARAQTRGHAANVARAEAFARVGYIPPRLFQQYVAQLRRDQAERNRWFRYYRSYVPRTYVPRTRY